MGYMDNGTAIIIIAMGVTAGFY